jgi:hypothetical protein
MIPGWLSTLLPLIRDLGQMILAYAFGREQLKREQAEESIELHEMYEKLDETNKAYRARGKLGLLQRLRKYRDKAPK